VVLGSGRMAPGLAAALAAGGCEVTIAGRVPGRAQLAADAGSRLAGREVRAGGIEEPVLAGADLVLESVVEDLAVKQELLARVEPWLEPGAVVATNTSSLRVGDVAATLQRRERALALHFMFPAHLSPMVEVMPGADTDPVVVERATELCRAMGKTPVRIAVDVKGMVWNRLQFALLREALALLEAGVADAATIDACLELGLARRWIATGPLATVELGGLDTFRRVAEQLYPDLSRATEPPRLLAEGVRPMDEAARGAATRLRARALEVTEPIAAERRAGLEA
jgi:3-hydroxybutyryl-CoA dehydrogenase